TNHLFLFFGRAQPYIHFSFSEDTRRRSRVILRFFLDVFRPYSVLLSLGNVVPMYRGFPLPYFRDPPPAASPPIALRRGLRYVIHHRLILLPAYVDFSCGHGAIFVCPQECNMNRSSWSIENHDPVPYDRCRPVILARYRNHHPLFHYFAG